MWPHRDLGWWGFWISIIALLVTYPLGLLANLTSPKLKNWWARRSQESLARRIARLKEVLAEIEKLPVLSETEDRILESGEATRRSIYLAGCLVLFVTLLNGGFEVVVFSPKDHNQISMLGIFLVTFLLLWSVLQHNLDGPLIEYRMDRSPRSRAELKSDIANLEAGLRKRQGDGSQS
jgi:hypothetical protein